MRGKVIFPKNLRQQFIKAAKAAFPREEFACLLGRRDENGIFSIEELYFPPGRENSATKDYVQPELDWFEWAREIGFQKGLIILGDIHSHCYDANKEGVADTSPSEQDFTYLAAIKDEVEHYYSILGICRVAKKGRRFYSDIVLYPAMIPYEILEAHPFE